MEYDEEVFLPEYSQNQKPTYNKINSKHKTTIDYMKLYSEEYLQHKLSEKVKSKILQLNLSEKYIIEIINMCKLYIVKLRMKLSTLLPIITYKIIKKYDIPIHLNELAQKIRFSKGKYLKFSPKIVIKSNVDEDSVTKYGNTLFSYYTYLVQQLTAYSHECPMVFKVTKSANGDTLDSLVDKFFANAHGGTDCNKILNDSKIEAKELFYSFDFYESFNNKILPEALVAATLRHIVMRNNIRINLQFFKDKFNMSTSGISKGGKMLQSFMKEFSNRKNVN